jgi:hypothetical protein
MKRLLLLPLALWVAVFPSALVAQTPTDALRELVQVSKPEEVERFLTEAAIEKLRALPIEDRKDFLQRLAVKKLLEGESTSLVDSPDPMVLVHLRETRDKDGQPDVHELRIRVERLFFEGSDALVQLSFCQNNEECQTGSFVVMRHEGGRWRLAQVMQLTMQLDLEKELDNVPKLRQDRPRGNEASAVGSLRKYNTAIVVYVSTYPDIGLPASVKVLGGTGEEATAENALLVDELMACDGSSCVKSGYRFTYTPVNRSEGRYEITAVPTSYGSTGTRSFFTDETGVIRFSKEDRPATAQDPPLQ